MKKMSTIEVEEQYHTQIKAILTFVLYNRRYFYGHKTKQTITNLLKKHNELKSIYEAMLRIH